jgi:hypothetical protein
MRIIEQAGPYAVSLVKRNLECMFLFLFWQSFGIPLTKLTGSSWKRHTAMAKMIPNPAANRTDDNCATSMSILRNNE